VGCSANKFYILQTALLSIIDIPKKNKHDRYVESLSETLLSQYALILRNVMIYSSNKRCVAEVDLLGLNEEYCDIYEVKCSHRIAKARQQLRKVRKLLSAEQYVRHSFFYCGNSKELVKINPIKPKHR